jgi:hypothetical protein
MRKITLNITKAHIAEGQAANPGKCPIANSLIENIKNITYVSVLPNDATIRVKNGSNVVSYKSKLSSKAYSFVKKFDDGRIVKPFTLSFNFERIDKNISELV